MNDAIEIVVNGAAKKILRGTTVARLIFELGLAERRVAVERNREIVPRDRHASCELEAGDRLELVTFVGGG
jgi:sulfur carrier protein